MQNCHPVNAIDGQDWHSEMIHYVWTDWKLGHAFPNFDGNAPPTCREGHNMYTNFIYMYLHAHDGWLPVQHSEFLQHLRQCYHAVRHSSWYLSTDLVIKLTCMWSLKITQGRGCWQDGKLTSKKSTQHKTCTTARQQKDTDDANKIIEYLDSENPFDVTLSLCILMILVLLAINQGQLTCRRVRTKNPWQHDWSQGSRPYDQEELHQATSDTVSVDLLLLFQHLITAGWCRYAKVWTIAMFLSSSTIWWWSGETFWDWWDACSRTNCNTRCCPCTT